MKARTRTVASLFSIALAAMLLGAVVTSQVHRAPAVQAKAAEVMSGPANRAQGPLTLDTFRDIARDNNAGVVNISTKKVVNRRQSRDPFRDFFGDDLMERFFGPQAGPDRQTLRSLGSGFVVDKDGYVLTNRHVVEGADEVTVTFSNGKAYDKAKVVGKDARTDIALLKIEPKEALTVLELGDSDKAEVGEWVMAIGSPFNLGNSVTVGVVSFNGRNLTLSPGTGIDMIQTDAAINPGNSGGPLLNAVGQVIGINTLIFTQGAAQSSGVGFSVPINVAKGILPQLREKGRVVRGWIGVAIGTVDEDLAKTFKMKEAKGAVVNDVTKDSPADKAGLKPEDVVIAADNRKIESRNDLSSYIGSKTPGTTVRLQVVRDGSERTVAVTLGTFPEEGERTESQASQKGKLGMSLHNLTPEFAERLDLPRGTRGVVVTEIEGGEAADEAGLQRGDVIVGVNGHAVSGVDDFEALVDRARSEGRARLRVRRGGAYVFVVLKLS